MLARIATTPALSPDDDFTTESGAYRLASKIREFWGMRGLFPKVWVAKVMNAASFSDSERTMYIVKSDMVAGRPQ